MISIKALDSIDMSAAPLPANWQGALDHIGPVQTVTPLVDRLSGKTTCATVAMIAGVVTWGAARLRPFTDTGFLYELAEASFAWQFDWRYLDTEVEPKGKPADQPVEVSAPMVLRSFVRKSIRGEKPWHSFYQPTMELFHMSSGVSFILPPDLRDIFEDWLVQTSDRLDALCAAPNLEVPDFADFENKQAYRDYCAPRRGAPVPMLALDPTIAIEADGLSDRALEELRKLDPRANRYLRTAEQMAALGFDGQPYGAT